MTQQRENIESLVRNLKNASQLLDGVARDSESLETSLNRSNFVQSVGRILVSIFDLECDLFDLEPTLTEDYLKPSLDAIDLSAALESLLSNNAAIRENTIKQFKSYMLDETADQFAISCESGTGYDFAQTWWQQQEKPFLPVVSVYKNLRHERRFMQYQSAKVLEEEFGVKIWDDDRDDLSLEIADRWFSDWLNRSSA